jgi:hypothetical protein
MTREPLQPLPPPVERLLAAERRVGPPAPEVVASVRARVLRTVSAPPPPATAGWHMVRGPLVWTSVAVAAAIAGAIIWRSSGTAPPAGVADPARPAPSMPPRTAPASPTPSAPVAPVVAEPRPARAVAAQSDPIVEHRLLEEGRRALGAGDTARALAVVRRHQVRWPAGALVQEREVLAVLALAKSGAHAEARARGERFLARYPGSTLAPRIRDTLARLPP